MIALLARSEIRIATDRARIRNGQHIVCVRAYYVQVAFDITVQREEVVAATKLDVDVTCLSRARTNSHCVVTREPCVAELACYVGIGCQCVYRHYPG